MSYSLYMLSPTYQPHNLKLHIHTLLLIMPTEPTLNRSPQKQLYSIHPSSRKHCGSDPRSIAPYPTSTSSSKPPIYPPTPLETHTSILPRTITTNSVRSVALNTRGASSRIYRIIAFYIMSEPSSARRWACVIRDLRANRLSSVSTKKSLGAVFLDLKMAGELHRERFLRR